MSKLITGGISAAFLSAFLTLLTACNSSDSGENAAVQNDIQLKRFDHCDDLKSYLISTNEQQNALFDYIGSLPVEFQDDFSSLPTPTTGNGSEQTNSQPAINSVTGTNNQVSGVDEADFIKTNGDYTYLLSGGYFMILQTWPADQSQELSRTEIDGTPRALFFREDIVWVVSDLSQQTYPQFEESLAADIAPRVNQMTKVTLLQVTDPAQPTLIRETVFESSYVDARRIDQQVYLIVSAQLDLNPALDDPENVEADELLPILADNTAPSTNTQATTSLICDCDAIYRPEIANGTGTTTILSFDLANPLADIPSQTVLGNSGMVYANQEHLYIASIEDPYWLWLPAMEGEESPTPSTTIHKFSLQSSPQYLATGSVDGHLLNQFAMDEYQGVLRLVTTEQPWWNTVAPDNRLYVMEQTGNQLLQQAKLDGLGKPGEIVYAVRFDQDKGYLVTFEQIDPLITLDLSDASNPVVAGELEVPGFSTYLHPIEGDMLLAIGQDTNTNGIKLSLFDISDFSQPMLLNDHLIGAGSYSEAAYNHHAFTWYEQEQMLAIPVTQWNSQPLDTALDINDIFNGLELFSVTAQQGIQPYAAIDHDVFYQDQNNSKWYYPEGIRRSFFVADDAMNSYIYSISDRGLLVNDLASPDINLAEIALPTDSDNVYLFNEAQLARFDHCDELKSYLITTNEQQNELLYNYGGSSDDDFSSAPISTPPTPVFDSGQTDSQPTINSVTGTNNQVADVDEADFIKTNGEYTYLLSGGNLMILQTWPADQSQELSRTEIDGTPRALFFYEDVVWVVSDLSQQSYPQFEESLAADFAPRTSQMTKVTLFRITDPQQPSLIRETVFESSYVDARRIGQQVYLIVSAFIDLNPALDDPDNVEVDELLPILSDNKTPATNTQPTTSVICNCDAIYRPEIPNGTGTMTILSFDLANPLADIPGQTVLGNSGMVYANQEHLYIAAIEDQYWLWMPVMEGAANPTPGTTIHKFSLQSSPQYLASGRVDGHLLNQFAMDEYQGVLRLVTSEQQTWSWWNNGGPKNQLYILAQTGDQLAQRAHLDGLGKPGESVFAVRFDEEKGYLVTFERIDPLITLDLSDSRTPLVAGELEVPGFSTYLHPIEGDMILAIGRDTVGGGIKLSLFDISDFAQPALLADHRVGAGSYTEAAYNHHAFTWFEQEQMLAIPVTQWGNPFTGTTFGFNDIFNGLELFRVTVQEGIQSYAAIDHDIFYQAPNNSNFYYPEGIRRSFFVADDAMNSYIYSISGRGLLVNDLASPDINLAEIELPADNSDYLFSTPAGF
ncbi:MAG: beta-propeller domain-containing protein [Candidatus Thiodiazotropha sp. (ex Epidulcina cf. delphinae)]|nr:beta-propeller domain-containing protein [Candidatus Thiodiazotropha sp. (ex Epidulcina cf. delphinae)]